MKRQRTIEIMVGVFMAVGLASLFLLAMKVSNLASFSGNDGYTVTAAFENIGGLKERAPITMAGVRIGRVADIDIDPQTFEARVTLRIDKRHNRLPADSNAKIYTAGLLGEQYIALEAGGSDRPLKQGDHLKITQSAMVMEDLIGQFLFNKAADGNKGEGGASP